MTSMLCDRYFGFSAIEKKNNNKVLQRWCVLAF